MRHINIWKCVQFRCYFRHVWADGMNKRGLVICCPVHLREWRGKQDERLPQTSMQVVSESNQQAHCWMHARGRLGTNLLHLEIKTFNSGCLSQPLRVSNERKFSALHEEIEGNHSKGLDSTLSSCTLLAGAWRLNPTASGQGVFKTLK